MQNRKLAVALGLLGATMLSTPACAQAAAGSTAPASAPTAAPSDQAVQAVTIETVVVTARRRAENLERVPVAVTAISPETIRDENIKSALDLQDLSPSLSVSGSLGSRDDNVFTIRGQSQPFGGADPGVQSYFNEVPFGGSGPGYYYDMDNIQVLRGPQGTLFGRNTTGGAVLFQPKKPSDQFGGYLDGQVGDFAMHEVQGALNVPVIGDKLMIRVAGDWNRRNGFTKDLSTGSDLDNVSYDAFRVGVTVKPFKGFENNFEFNYLNNHDHGTGAQLTGIASDATLQARYDAQVSALLYPSVYSGLVTTFMNPPYNLLLATAQTQASAQAPAIALAQAQLTIDGMYYTMLVPALSSQQALGPRKTTSTIPLFYKRHTMDLTDTAQYDILEHLRIRNIFGYLIDETQSAFDYDGNAMALLEIPNARTWEQNSRQITEEFQVTGETEDDMWNWIAGFYYGSRGWSSPLPKRFLIGVTLLFVFAALLPFVSSIVALGLIGLLVGATVAPTLINGNSLVGRLVPNGRLTEGLSWMGTGIGIGASIGSSVSGGVIDRAGYHGGLITVVVFAALAAIVALASSRTLRRASSDEDARTLAAETP